MAHAYKVALFDTLGVKQSSVLWLWYKHLGLWRDDPFEELKIVDK